MQQDNLITIDNNNDNDKTRGDPLAQSFIVDEEDGIFITSLDAFFATKSSTIPVKQKLEIWSMVIHNLKYYLLQENG